MTMRLYAAFLEQLFRRDEEKHEAEVTRMSRCLRG